MAAYGPKSRETIGVCWGPAAEQDEEDRQLAMMLLGHKVKAKEDKV